MTDTILVTGGAGYIGSHACKALAANGFTPVTYDSLITGWEDAVRFGPFEKGCLLDQERLQDVINYYRPKAVMHFAALSNSEEASRVPNVYWQNNVAGTLCLLEAMRACSVGKIIFSSTCAIYGEQKNVALEEETSKEPLNAYGASKLAVEHMLSNYSQARGLCYVSLRYFNVAGCDADGEIGECHRPETHLIPLALEVAMGRREILTVFGTDYDTPDGTCIRDYIHIVDLVQAHVLALRYIMNGGVSDQFNLGTTHGFSVREVINSVETVTNRTLPVAFGNRRKGDAAKLVSGSSKASAVLGWTPQHLNIDEMVSSAWKWARRGKLYTK